MVKNLRLHKPSGLILVLGLLVVVFSTGVLAATALTPPITATNLVGEEPRWADQNTIAKVQWLTNNVFAEDSSLNVYQKFNNLGPDDQITLVQAHRLTQGNLRANNTTIQRPVGNDQNANCAQISVNYEFTGTAGQKVLTFPAFHEICYFGGKILTNYTTSSFNAAAPASSLWNYYSASSQITNGGNTQNTIEITVQTFYRLCVTSPSQGCVNKAHPAYKITFDAANGSSRVEGLNIPNPNV
jgi:hypothetical protein